MTRLSRKLSKMFAAVFGFLLVGGAVAFAQHNATLTKNFANPTKAATEASPVSAEVPNNRPLIKLLLAGAIDRNNKTIPVDVAGPVTRGEVVSFTLSSVNEGSAAAREYRAIGQIPQGTTFVAGSAVGENAGQVRYSIDGGQVFSSNPLIDEKQPDGTNKKVAAPVSMYTQVSFEWTDPLAVGGKLMASYQVRVK
jgi:uncharacterized repeat protein (TIGR01451 family)